MNYFIENLTKTGFIWINNYGNGCAMLFYRFWRLRNDFQQLIYHFCTLRNGFFALRNHFSTLRNHFYRLIYDFCEPLPFFFYNSVTFSARPKMLRK